MIRESFVIAKEEWESRLQINVWDGNFSTKTEKIVGDKTKVDNFASKMLSDDYREKVWEANYLVKVKILAQTINVVIYSEGLNRPQRLEYRPLNMLP